MEGSARAKPPVGSESPSAAPYRLSAPRGTASADKSAALIDPISTWAEPGHRRLPRIFLRCTDTRRKEAQHMEPFPPDSPKYWGMDMDDRPTRNGI